MINLEPHEEKGAFTFQLPLKTKELFEEYCSSQERPVSWVLRKMVVDFLKEKKLLD